MRGSIIAGVAAAIIGCAFFSDIACCDLWFIRNCDAPDYYFANSETASSISSEIIEDLSDSASVISAIIH